MIACFQIADSKFTIYCMCKYCTVVIRFFRFDFSTFCWDEYGTLCVPFSENYINSLARCPQFIRYSLSWTLSHYMFI